MTCNCKNQMICGCDFNIKTVGVCDVSTLNFDGEVSEDLNWTEISIPEILCIPEVKPEIENIDQVYASIILNCTKLIETPFAYKSYPLCYLPTSVLAAINTILETLDTSVAAIGTALDAITAVLDAIAAVPALPTAIATIIDDLSTALGDAFTAVEDAATALIDAMSVANPLASLVCEAIQALIVALNALTLVVNTVIPTINAILAQVSDALAALIQAAIDTALGLLGLTLEEVIQAVIDAINVILTPLLAIDCDPGYAFEIIGNAEGTLLTGRKLIIEGVLKQKIVYTADLPNQSVHSAHFEVPFIAFIIPYAKFEGITGPQKLTVYDSKLGTCREISGYPYDPTLGITVDLSQEFEIKSCIEDIYVKSLDTKKVFKNVTAFFKAIPSSVVLCN